MSIIAQAAILMQQYLDDYFKAVYIKNEISQVEDEELETDSDLTPIEQEITYCLEGVLDARFKVDFHLMGSRAEIVDYYNGLVYNELDASYLRLLSNSINYITVNFSEATFINRLITEMATLLSSYSNIVAEQTTLSPSTIKVLTQTEWKLLLSNNPWLLAVNIIKFIPACHVLLYSQPEMLLMEQGLSDETRNND